MVYLKDNIPFRHPVVVGTELVSFSALLTARHAGIKPVAMIEENAGITARALCRPLPAMLGVPLYRNIRVVEILGKDRVTGLRVSTDSGADRVIDCDGILFTGQFTPESALLRIGHLDVDQASGGPVVDQYGRCSDPAYFATGNLLRPVETAGWCWREGVRIASYVHDSLDGKLSPSQEKIEILSKSPIIKFVVPQVVSLPVGGSGADHLQLRFTRPTRGRLTMVQDGTTTWSQNVKVKPERRVLVPVGYPTDTKVIEITFTETP